MRDQTPVGPLAFDDRKNAVSIPLGRADVHVVVERALALLLRHGRVDRRLALQQLRDRDRRAFAQFDFDVFQQNREPLERPARVVVLLEVADRRAGRRRRRLDLLVGERDAARALVPTRALYAPL